MRTIGWIVLGALLIVLIGGMIYYFVHPMFGGSPKGARLERIKQSPNFKNGVFHNLEVTPSLKKDVNIAGLLWGFLFSQNASPIPGSNRAFKMSVDYALLVFPKIDYLFISHDHYDHLDYETIVKLRDKVGQVICGLGVGAHFESWGYQAEQIIEGDWYDQLKLDPDFQVTFTPARHFSGRRFTRNSTLWTSFVLKTSKYNLFLGGDSGYGKHFKAIGDQFGPFDLAILENGQYNDAWHYIHSLPEEWAIETKELKAKVTLPVHSSKFALAMHDWNEPMEKFYETANKEHIPILTPKIGELVHLNKLDTVYAPWWRELP